MRLYLSLFSLLLAVTPLSAGTIDFGWGSTDVKYASDSKPSGLSSALNTYENKAWKGERINLEAVIWAPESVAELSLETGRLSCGKYSIPSNAVKASFVEYVVGDKLALANHQCGCRDTVNFQRVSSPDIIGRVDKVSLESGSAMPVWLSVDIPYDAVAGTYQGSLHLKSKGKIVKSLHYRIKVIDRILTPVSQRPFHLDFWQNPYSVARYHNVPLWSKEHFDHMRPVMENLARAGQKVVTATIMDRPWNGQTEDPYGSMVTKILRADGTWFYDYTVFDNWVNFMASIGIDEQINCYTIIPWSLKFDYYDQASGTVKYIEAAPGSDEYSWYWSPFIKDFARHLRARGWFSKTCIAMDERPEDAMIAAEALVHSVEPEMKISLAGNYHVSVAHKIFDLCIPMYSRYPDGVIAQRKAAGQLSTIYHCCSEPVPNLFIDSAPAEACWPGWMVLASGTQGFLRWAANSWTAQPFNDARFRTWAAGDTYCLYPDGVSSVRFERLCEGIQDYEKSRLLLLEWSSDPKSANRLTQLKNVISRFTKEEIEANGPVPLLHEARRILDLAGDEPAVSDNPTYKNAQASIEDRVEDLLSRMNFREKVMQLTQSVLYDPNPNNRWLDDYNLTKEAEVGSVISFTMDAQTTNDFQRKAMEETRLGIPVLFGWDVIHGFKTIFPVPLAHGASFNTSLVEQSCRIAAQEAYSAGVHWTFSPMIDIARDPRWGRIMEGYGEDPYTTSRFCEAAVKGYQGSNLSEPGHIAACLKHYVAYGASEAGRDYHAADVSRQTLWDTYLPPYYAGVKAGAATVMSSFETLSGVPASANHYTLTEVLRDKWGFKGFVVSDWQAVMQIKFQGCAADDAQAAEMAFNAGVDMDMTDDYYLRNFETLVEQGRISMDDIDESVRRILTVKFQLGLFDKPYRPETDPKRDFLRPEYLAAAEEMVAQSAVLMKNNGVLPLSKDSKIALIGPAADDGSILIGSWRAAGSFEDVITPLAGMKAEFPNLSYAKGCEIQGDDRSGFAQAIELAAAADIVVLCIGEGPDWTGENTTRGSISIPSIQEELLCELKKTGKPIVAVLESGRALDLRKLSQEADAILNVWLPGTCAGPGIAGLLSGRWNPSGKLPITYPRCVEQLPIYYNMRSQCRPGFAGEYIDGIELTPLYEFGYGLSYSTFNYSDITVDGMTATVSVTNTSDVDGMETVLWFVKDPVCSIARPVKELKHFEKRMIKAGETEIFCFEIDRMEDLGFVNECGDRFFEGGKFILSVSDKTKEIEIY